MCVGLLVCWCVGVCIELSLERNQSNADFETASVEARYFHLDQLLLAPKAVLSWWSLMVVCALITRDTFQA